MSKQSDELAFNSGGFPVGKKQLERIISDIFHMSNDLTEDMRHKLMLQHSEDWDMETVAEAAHICSVVAQRALHERVKDVVNVLINTGYIDAAMEVSRQYRIEDKDHAN